MIHVKTTEHVYQLPFDQGLFIPVLIGEQNVILSMTDLINRRLHKNGKIPGRFKEGFDIELEITEGTEQKTFDTLTGKDIKGSVFNTVAATFRKFKETFPKLEKTDPIFIIRFKVLMRRGHPIVSQNTYLRDRMTL